MDKLASVKKFASVALVAGAIVLAAVVPSQARGEAGHGFAGGHPGVGHGGFAVRRGFEGHREFGRGRHGHFFIGGGYPLYGYYPPAYGYSAPAYWYYCPSYGAYYPDVDSCPEAWVPVPASEGE